MSSIREFLRDLRQLVKAAVDNVKGFFESDEPKVDPAPPVMMGDSDPFHHKDK